MSVIDTLRDTLVPDTGEVHLECVECGRRFDEPRSECPNCGSDEIKEVGGFDMRPDT